MNIGVLGTGVVGRTIAARLEELGHDVIIGTRDVDSLMAAGPGPRGQEPFSAWSEQHAQVRVGTFAEAAGHGDVLFNATAGHATLDALKVAGEENLDGKILIDIANPLDFSQGMPPTLTVSNTDSLAEQIQRTFPGTRVVKTLNTVNARVMVDPGAVGGGDHHVFVSGNDEGAKAEVTAILRDWFGWRHVIDLGDITTSRGPEAYLLLWVTLLGVQQTSLFNVKIVR